MKKTMTLCVLIMGTAAFSQVGIQTETPQATLDVAGAPEDATKLDGIIAPRITGDQLRAKTYTTDQTGALVYVTAADTAPAGQTIDVTTTGYYYFNGTKWVITSGSDSDTDTSIYTVDGSITGTAADPNNVRTLNLNNNKLDFVGSTNMTRWTAGGTLIQTNLTDNNSVGSASIGLKASSSDPNSYLWIQKFPEGATQITSTGKTTSFSIGTSITADPDTYLRFNTLGLGRIYINSKGNVSMGSEANQFATESLDIFGSTGGGNVRIRELPKSGAANAIYTRPDGTASATQDQTFTATRTVVADAKGVLGYVDGLPGSGGGNGGVENQGGMSFYHGTWGAANTTGEGWLSSNLHDLPTLDGKIRIDGRITGTGAVSWNPTLVNVSDQPVKVWVAAISNVDRYSFGNVVLAPTGTTSGSSAAPASTPASTDGGGGYLELDNNIYANTGSNQRTNASPSTWHTSGNATNNANEVEVADIIVDGKWYRVYFFGIIDNKNETNAANMTREFYLSVQRLY